MQIYHNKCFVAPIDIITAFNSTEFINAFNKIESLKNQGLYLIGYIRYNAKDIFLGHEISSKFPLLYFEVYDDYAEYTPYNPLKHINIYSEPQITYGQYEQALTKIKTHISKGNTYEVNYTYPHKVYTNADNLELYNYLLLRQKTDYNAFIVNEWEEVLSFSPELFFKLEHNKITTKPMKGTIGRGKTEKEDKQNLEFLKNDEKNRAENVMIVDLLRNDLSKIAKTGTVHTDKLFEIESHETVFQMTSEISAELEEGTTLFDIFKAIFPCGSITGAPKISTMNIIEETEIFPRNIYCGAIGYISPNESVFSVPIRILQKDKLDNNKFYQYHTGGAIVWDSDIQDEWEETITKKKILDTEIKFKLLETVLIKDGEIKLYDYHKKRIEKSAKDLGFNFDTANFLFNTSKDCIARFLCSSDGTTEVEYKKITEIKTNKIKISNDRINSKNKFLYHKTTFRPWYNYGLGEYFDIIFLNERNEITEGTRSNVILKINGALYTPPTECGLLNGTYRQHMIDNKLVTEKVLYEEDLKNAEKIYCINSVRGMVEVEL